MDPIVTTPILTYVLATAIGVIVTIIVTKFMNRGDAAQITLNEKRDEREKEMFDMIKEMKTVIDKSFTEIKVHDNKHKRHDERLAEIELEIKALRDSGVKLRDDILSKLLNNIQR